MSKITLDATDQVLLRRLQEDARVANAELARDVHLSAPSTAQRLRRMERAEVIRGYRAVVNPEAVGLSVTVFVQITLSLHDEKPIESFREFVRKMPEVLECHNVSGDFDYLLKVVARDIGAYEALVRSRLSKAPAIERIQSLFVLKTSKSDTPMPI